MVIRFCCFRDYYSRICLPETIKSVGMRRQSLLSAFIFFETITVSFSFQRQSSSLACGDNHGHPILLFLRLLQSPLPSRDNQFHWHMETIMVIHFHCFQDYYSLLCLPEAIKSIGMQRQPYLLLFIFSKTIRVFFRDFDVSLTLQDFKVFC